MMHYNYISITAHWPATDNEPFGRYEYIADIADNDFAAHLISEIEDRYDDAAKIEITKHNQYGAAVKSDGSFWLDCCSECGSPDVEYGTYIRANGGEEIGDDVSAYCPNCAYDNPDVEPIKFGPEYTVDAHMVAKKLED